MAEVANIASLIAQVPRVPAIDFSPLGNLPNSYWEGLQQAYQQRNRDLFQNGVPSDPAQLTEMILKAGGSQAIPHAISLQELGLARDLANRPMPTMPGADNGGTGYTTPSISAPQPSASQAPLEQPQQPAAPPPGGTFTLRKLADARGLDADAIAGVMSQNGVRITPDTPLSPTQQTVAMVRDAITASRPAARVNEGFSQVAQAAPQETSPLQLQSSQLESTANRLDAIADELDKRAEAAGALKNAPLAQRLGAESAARRKQASDIRESLLRQREIGATGEKEKAQTEAKAATSIEEDVVKSARAAADLQPYIDRAISAYQKAAKLGGVGPVVGNPIVRTGAAVLHTDAESARQDYDTALKSLQARITAAQNKGEGSVSNYERRMYSQQFPELTASDPGKQLDYLKGIQAFTSQTIDAGRSSKLAKSPTVSSTMERAKIGTEAEWKQLSPGVRIREIK